MAYVSTYIQFPQAFIKTFSEPPVDAGMYLVFTEDQLFEFLWRIKGIKMTFSTTATVTAVSSALSSVAAGLSTDVFPDNRNSTEPQIVSSAGVLDDTYFSDSNGETKGSLIGPYPAMYASAHISAYGYFWVSSGFCYKKDDLYYLGLGDPHYDIFLSFGAEASAVYRAAALDPQFRSSLVERYDFGGYGTHTIDLNFGFLRLVGWYSIQNYGDPTTAHTQIIKTGSLFPTINIEPIEYWPYDPGDTDPYPGKDGSGPVYNSTTGAQLRDPFNIVQNGDGSFYNPNA